jgi:hypothetical protein
MSKPVVLWIILTTSALLLGSCEREIEIEAPQHQPKLVLQSFINKTDTSVVAHVYNTFSINAVVSQEPLKTATVKLYQGANLLGNLLYVNADQHYYARPTRFSSGRTYRIVAEAPGFPPVEAVAQMPSAVPVQQVRRLQNARLSSDGRFLDDIRIRFADPPGEKNYYYIAVNTEQVSYIGCVYSNDGAIELPNSQIDPFTSSNCINPSRILISDNTFDGQTKELTVSIDHGYLENFFQFSTSDKMWVNLYAVQEDFYRYLRSYESFIFNSSNPFLEPTIIHGNIKGGYGILALYTASRGMVPR